MSSPEPHAGLAPSAGLLVRPARRADAAALHALVTESEGALERFDDSASAVEALIAASERSLAGLARPAEEGCLLLIEEVASRQVLGCIALACRIGLEQPFYDYRLGKIVHSSRPLGSYRCLDVLYLCNDLTGASELHSLYVRRDSRHRGAAVQLLKAAQMFIAAHAPNFAPRVITELRGVVDDAGRSPFWESVGRHFFQVDQRAAEKLVAKGHKAFIAELMPKHPVYVALLPEAAQQAIGGMHDAITALTGLLEHDGFRFECHVDIFDGGRVLEARTQELAGVVGSREAPARAGDPGDDASTWWLASGQDAAFRMLAGRGRLDGDTLVAEAATLALLGGEECDGRDQRAAAATVRVLPA